MLTTNDNNYSKYIIVSHARSGSNLLLTSLNSHPNIIAEHEIFAAHNRKIGENFYPILNHLFRERAENIKAVGCKIFYYHLNEDEWQELASIPELKIVHLQRKNRLSMIVSMKIAFKTKQWGITDESQIIDASQKKVHLNHEFLNKSFEDIESWENNIKMIFPQSQIQDIFYEDLVEKYDQSLYKVFDFLDVEQIPQKEIDTKHKKQNPEPLNELIQNYQELKNQFQNTAWEQYFNC
ncbi:Stf0 sulfotransferase [Xenococcus sp. PCC 7305]|uniref:sulfotransferase domain-containing protein n=1 Tax=Xenococcus sp. PCC 7305 TaxID=102125 RepID=UPI0002AC7F35|nr:sulfotransferase domain-containing protein [Xenococcus sp. PCC 7305]ELS03170.1 Stf0 sulfotransferase [Xenococcus sp. PCC 7305]